MERSTAEIYAEIEKLNQEVILAMSRIAILHAELDHRQVQVLMGERYE